MTVQHIPPFYLRSLFLLTLCFFGAGTQVRGQPPLGAKATRQLQQLVEFNPVFEQAHTGFVLYDMDYQSHLYGFNSDRKFVPASNIKLLTFYLANRLLGHRAPGVFYQEFADHLELWGSGYPLALHPDFGAYDELYPWLARQTKPITINFPVGPGAVSRYGAGWSWDDYNDSYVYERSAFPLYGNRLFMDLSPVDSLGRQSLLGSPPSVVGALRQPDGQEVRIRRSEFGNDFTVGPSFYEPLRFPLERPLHLSPEFLTNELAIALPQIQISTGYAPYPEASQLNVLEASLPDTVFRKLLQESDNYLAEQLLLQAAAKRYGLPSTEMVIDYARDTLFPSLGVEGIRWVDGSGLSRYNLISPRQMTRIVLALDQEVGRDRLLSLLPAGGESGTLKNRYNNEEKTYLWAKTGSLSGVACLSGMLLTKRGKWLAFSFMHNNYVGSSRAYYEEMEKTLGWCHENL